MAHHNYAVLSGSPIFANSFPIEAAFLILEAELKGIQELKKNL